jgi:DNA-binding IclR family transcriptional regulator
MGFWDKSLLVFKYLCDYGRQGVRRIAQQTGLSKSSVHQGDRTILIIPLS